MLGLCLIVFGRVFYLQIIQYETYASLGEENSIRQEFVSPARGLIYDRNGVLITDNEPIFSITVTPSNFDEDKIPLLTELLQVEDSVITTRIDEAQRYSWYRTSPLLTDVDFETFSLIQENIWQLPGIGHQIESKRHYPTNMKASHIFGYLREADRNDYESSEDLRLGDKIGKSGLEMVYEDALRGDLGVEFLKVNAYGQSLGNYEGERSGRNPTQGGNIITTIDSELQAYVEELMQDKIGAVVVMNPHTGEILSLVSSPNYDVERLAGRLDRDYWVEINSDSTRPLFNRAISSRQPPGSTFKPLMGIIGLHLGYITPETVVRNTGGYRRGRLYRDIAELGDYDLEKAIAYSSNTYFYALMDRISSQGDLNNWSKLVKDFGLGVPTSIDLPSSTTGIIPDSAYMDRRFGKRQWGLGDLINLGIGQGVISVSPLQIAQMTSSIANGGYRIRPHLVQSIQQSNGEVQITPEVHEKISWVKPEYLDLVKIGMRRVVQEGSGRFYAKTNIIDIAGKTGTAENPHGFSHGWFTSFAPFDDPQIVVTVFLENAGFASTSAAPIASLILEKYLTGEVNRPYTYNHVMNWVPKEDNSQREAE
ncbi:MAG: penicillin-binding protein 2 [Balneolaceae bacterium]|nr:penicillin-binding protein 2 [Balneolaceae bacterium]MBO6547629.1 penicillin-binding protein 2 [Balneolaceae bacterium]MBO6648140.1 penicillin-binding protein 2 [Balneolaceae bacterium]